MPSVPTGGRYVLGPTPSFSPRLLFAVAILSALVCSLAAGVGGLHLLYLRGGQGLPACLLGCVAGVLAADFATAVVHWACDTWGGSDTPYVGATLIRSFREHHHSPQAMLAHDWIEVNGEAAVTALAALVLFLPALVWPHASGDLFFTSFLWALLSFSAFTNQLHQWAHQPSPPRLVARLQQLGLLLSAVRHDQHHRAPHLTNYCISTGWLNGVLDTLNFWRGLEGMISRLTGAKARSHP